MLSRRNFIKINGITTAGLGLGLRPAWFLNTYESKRPKLSERKFTSTAIENDIINNK